MWKIEYDNDTGSNDEGFWEWWSVTNGEHSYIAKTEKGIILLDFEKDY